MFGTVLATLAAMTTGAIAPAESGRLTIWWRTAGAEAIEQQLPDGSGSCSLILHHSGNEAILMRPLRSAPELFVQDPAWSSGPTERNTVVSLVVGSPGVATSLSAVVYQDWVRIPLDQVIADALPNAGAFRIEFPGGQASPADFPMQNIGMASVRRGLARCQAMLTRTG